MADDAPLLVVLGSSLPLLNKKATVVGSHLTKLSGSAHDHRLRKDSRCGNRGSWVAQIFSFKCLYNLPKSFPKSSSLWQFNTNTWSKHCNSGTSSQVYTWHQTFYLIKHHTTLGRFIHIYYRFSAIKLVCGVYSYPPPLPLHLAFTMMLSVCRIIVFVHCFHKAVCFFFFFSVLVLVLFSNEYPPLNMLN